MFKMNARPSALCHGGFSGEILSEKGWRAFESRESFSEDLNFSGVQATRQKKGPPKGKGCDIGYALAANSCEGVNNVDACTVTALDVNTAFAAPNPGFPLAETAGFFGSERPANCFTEPITQSTSAQKLFISTEPFDRRRGQSYIKDACCQYTRVVQTKIFFDVTWRMCKPQEMRMRNMRTEFHPRYPQGFPQKVFATKCPKSKVGGRAVSNESLDVQRRLPHCC
ncbi:MAG: hypothetical protein ACHP79_01140 [Terriglobales bacterium]